MHHDLFSCKIRIFPHKVVFFKVEWHKCLPCNRFSENPVSFFSMFITEARTRRHQRKVRRRLSKEKLFFKEELFIQKFIQNSLLKEELLQFLLENQVQSRECKKTFSSFLPATPTLSSWPYLVLVSRFKTHSTTKFIILHYHLFMSY